MFYFILGRNNPQGVLKQTTGQGLFLYHAFIYMFIAAGTLEAGINESAVNILVTLPKWTLLALPARLVFCISHHHSISGGLWLGKEGFGSWAFGTQE